MPKAKDILGLKFGRLTAIEFSHKEKNERIWKCRCDCGKIVYSTVGRLQCGNTKSCGCLKTDILIERNKKHGLSCHSLYSKHYDMKSRCYDVKNDRYKNYGRRGIIVCDEWNNSFEKFYEWSIKNGYKKGLTIDRIDVNGDYEPSNCRWISNESQARNRTNNHLITIKGETRCLQEWADIVGTHYTSFLDRIKNGWSEEQLLKPSLDGNKKLITYKGETKSVVEWSKTLNMDAKNLQLRLRRGWSVERAFTTPKKET